MRLTSVTIAFIFFSTVFATPIFRLRGNAVELSKRVLPGETTTTTGAAGGDDQPGRGRKPSRGVPRSASSKRKATDIGDEGADGSRSRSKKRVTCAPDLITKEEFFEALKHIDKSKPAGRGSQGLAVYHITELVQGCKAVVKIMDRTRLDAAAIRKVSNEVANLRQAKQLFGWGRRTIPALDYILMRNMGVPLAKTPLDLAKDAAFIQKKKDEALKRYEDEFHLKHGDPAGNGNYLWYINEEVEASDMENRYTVNVVDWADAEKIGPDTNVFAQAPPAHTIPDTKDIFGPTSSPESSTKESTTPPSQSDEEMKANIPSHSGATGTRSSTRLAAKGQGTSGQT
ncbi:hypothetical protein F5887DRAFT_49605 [Amanita rubescens]|nr:hypothetical protein F5887DRAFT_49605 [Amanita rubescens]